MTTGLIRSHAYSVTGVRIVTIHVGGSNGKIPLIRLRSPWGDDFEWKGPWSDR